MQVRKKIGLFLLLWMLLFLPVHAEEETWISETLEQSGAQTLWDTLSDETRALYDTMGIESLEDLLQVPLDDQLPQTAWQLLTEQFQKPLKVAAVLLAAIVLCAYFNGMRHTVSGQGLGQVYAAVSTLTVTGVIITPFSACIRAVTKALSGASVFMGSFSPVYLTVLATEGKWRAAASYQTVLLLFSQLLTWLTDGVLVPLLLCAVAMGMMTTVSDSGNLGKIGEMLLKAVSWTLGILAGIFSTLLSVNTMLGTAGDTLHNKMVKLSLSSFVPVVGNAVSEAYLTVKSCFSLVRTTIGAFGILTVALMVLPAMLQCLAWFGTFWICEMAAEVFEQDALSGWLHMLIRVVKTMLAALAVCALFMIIATAIVTLTGGGST